MNNKLFLTVLSSSLLENWLMIMLEPSYTLVTDTWYLPDTSLAIWSVRVRSMTSASQVLGSNEGERGPSPPRLARCPPRMVLVTISSAEGGQWSHVCWHTMYWHTNLETCPSGQTRQPWRQLRPHISKWMSCQMDEICLKFYQIISTLFFKTSGAQCRKHWTTPMW